MWKVITHGKKERVQFCCITFVFQDKRFVPEKRTDLNGQRTYQVSGLPHYTNCTVSMRARPSQPAGLDGPWNNRSVTTAEDGWFYWLFHAEHLGASFCKVTCIIFDLIH
jgi:hypothetical protein